MLFSCGYHDGHLHLSCTHDGLCHQSRCDFIVYHPADVEKKRNILLCYQEMGLISYLWRLCCSGKCFGTITYKRSCVVITCSLVICCQAHIMLHSEFTMEHSVTWKAWSSDHWRYINEPGVVQTETLSFVSWNTEVHVSIVNKMLNVQQCKSCLLCRTHELSWKPHNESRLCRSNLAFGSLQ